MKFLEIFGYRHSREDHYLIAISNFEKLIAKEHEIKKEWCKTCLVKVSDIIRIQQFTTNGETYYFVIVANQFDQGNLGTNWSGLGLIIDEGEYVQIKEFLNQ